MRPGGKILHLSPNDERSQKLFKVLKLRFAKDLKEFEMQ